MKNNQARPIVRVLAAPLAILAWLVVVLLGVDAISGANFKTLAGCFGFGLPALLFTFVTFKGEVPRWLYVILTWGERP